MESCFSARNGMVKMLQSPTLLNPELTGSNGGVVSLLNNTTKSSLNDSTVTKIILITGEEIPIIAGSLFIIDEENRPLDEIYFTAQRAIPYLWRIHGALSSVSQFV